MKKFLLSILLVAGAIVLLAISCIAIPFVFLKTLFKYRGLEKLSGYWTDVAIVTDTVANVIGAPILNWLAVKDTPVPFGSTRETLSFVIAVNDKMEKLTEVGIFIAKMLEKADEGHLERAIIKQLLYATNRKALIKDIIGVTI